MRGWLATVAAAVGLIVGGTANAAVVFDTSLMSPPGVYYGNGNGGTNVHWATDTENGLQLGLQALIRYTGPVSPTANIYDVPLGDTTVPTRHGSAWGFAFSALDNVGLIDSVKLSVSIRDALHGNTVTFNPFALPDNGGTDGTTSVGGSSGCSAAPSSSACEAASQTGIQNSETLSFTNGVASGFDPNYNASENNSWRITLSAYDSTGTTLLGRVDEIVNAGAGSPLPEPTSVMLLASGVIGLLLLTRHRIASRRGRVI